MQYTIEARELMNGVTHQSTSDGETRSTTIEATDVDEAISQYVTQSASELVSVTKPARCQESIATIRKDDCVYLVRVYAA